jgi:hypothetical protein
MLMNWNNQHGAQGVLASIDLTKASDYIHFTQNNKGRKND